MVTEKKGQASLWGGLLRREIWSICLYLGLVDMVIGMVAPTLSLFARSLGASLSLVGLLAAMLGLARFAAGLLSGALSDRRGRKSILLLGLAGMGLACLLYALAASPEALLPINALFGLSFVACLTTGLASAADLASVRERSLVFGVATTAMGLGFALGSLAGGLVAARSGYPAAYLAALGLAGLGLLAAWRALPGESRPAGPVAPPTLSWARQIGALLANPIIRAACLGSILSNLVFGGLVLTFFPIYAHGLGLTQAAIGSMIATRTLASTLARLPAGILVPIFPGRRLMLAALLVSTGAAFWLSQFTAPAALLLLLIAEGIAYGLFLTSGQVAIAEHAPPGGRGAALGSYMASASLGDSLAPLLLGLAADLLGIRSVFYIGAGLALLGVASIAHILARPERVWSDKL